MTTFSLLLRSYLHVLCCALDDGDEKAEEEVGEGGKEDPEEEEVECQEGG